MQMRRILSFAPLGLAFATMLASSAEAQRRTQVVICRDGSRFDTDNASVCDRHRGVDGRATEDARRYEADRVANRGRGNGRWDNGRDDRDNGRDDRDNRRDDRDNRRDDRDNRRDDRDNRRDQSDPRYDNRDNRGNGGQYDPRYGGYGSNGRNAVYEFQGTVDKEIQIQLRGSRAFVQPIGAGDSHAGGYGRVMNGLPQQSGTLVVERMQGRGDVDVIAQPSAQNNYTATLRVRDPKGGADNYRFVVYFQPNANDRYGTGRYGRN